MPAEHVYVFDACAVIALPGRLKAEWRRVSLVDCFALALVTRENATFVTSDHHELDPIAQAEVCPFRFIR